MRKMFVSTVLATALMFANAVPAFAADQEPGNSPVVAGASESKEASEAGPQTKEAAEEPAAVQAAPAATESKSEEKLTQKAPEKDVAEETPVEKSDVKDGLVEVKEAYANWDFRRSFRDYVGASGETLEDVATLAKGRHLLWAPKPGQKLDLSGKIGKLEFVGKVHWLKYGGILDVWIANPTIDFSKKQLLADGYTKGTMAKEGERSFTQEPIADLNDLKVEQHEGYIVVSSLDPVLTANVKSLVGFYEGEKGAPLVITIGTDEAKKADVPEPVLWELFPNRWENPVHGPVYSDDPVAEVTIADKGLEQCIRAALDRDYDAADERARLPITNKDLESLQVLNCQARNIESLNGIEKAINLATANFYTNKITDLSPLSKLTKLSDLDVEKNRLASIDPLVGLTKLERLNIASNWLTDITTVTKLPELVNLNVSDNRIADIKQAKLTPERVDVLNLSKNRISDLSAWKDMPVITDVDLSHNLIDDLGTLPERTGTRKLNLEYNFITKPEQLLPWADRIEYIDRIKLANNKVDYAGWQKLEPFTTAKDNWGEPRRVLLNYPQNEQAAQDLMNSASLAEVQAKHAEQDAKITAEIADIQAQIEAKKAEEAAKKQAEEEASRKAAEEEAAKKQAEEEAARKAKKAKSKTFRATLDWGVKESFRNYIKNGPAQGTWELKDGVTGEFTFPMKAGEVITEKSAHNEVNFAGTVHFTGHHGLLDLAISDPTVKKVNGEWKLIATITTRPFDAKDIGKVYANPGAFKPSEPQTQRATLATLTNPQHNRDGQNISLTFATVKLTEEGAKAFANFYKSDQELDQVTLKMTPMPARDEQPDTNSANQQVGTQKGQNNSHGKEVTDVTTKTGSDSVKTSGSNADNKAPEIKKCAVDPNKKRITSGNLSWALRSSFTTYIRGSIAHGGWTLGGGASWDGANFNFPATGGLFNTSTRTGNIYYGGTVHFTGHDGILDMTISNPSIAINGNRGSLYMTVSGSDMSGKKFNLGRVNFATITFSGVNVTDGALNFSGASVNLTDAGAKAFAGFYKAGEQLAPMSSSVKLVPATACDPETGELIEYDAFGGNLAQTGLDAQGLLAVSILVLFAGMGMIGLRRRHALDVVSGVDQK
ncbi:HtaA domain-containing protein [Arcanobacterium phocae]|uniref:HtaA domain-containing protein n=3 Tax=Arcanobacterium phocae TaxID=131112 RepID=UPI001C10F308|nr:HtaA domain-containing protein [Arcanobacterium phocae]